MLAVVIAALVFSGVLHFGGGSIVIPDVSGMSEEEALSALKESGIGEDRIQVEESAQRGYRGRRCRRCLSAGG